MASQNNLGRLEQRLFRFFGQDGLTEILSGIMLISCIFIIGNRAFIGLAVLLIIFGPVFLNKFRQRITYPRIGYMEPKKKPDHRINRASVIIISAMIIVWAIMVLLMGGFTDAEILYRWIPTLLAFILTGLWFFLAERTGQKRHYFFAVLMIVGAVTISLLEFDNAFANVRLFCLAGGSIFFISGIVKLIIFLKKYPAPDLEENHGQI